MQEVICLIAPTASGKTALAYELYETGRYYLISVDSALIYRDMNIGTAKPSADELQQYPHALVNIINPDESYSVAQFVKDVAMHIEIAHSQGKTPILVGGTMMYYMALLEGIADIPATLPEVRAQVIERIEQQGIQAVHTYLKQIDPKLGERLHPTDTQRIGRAVEVYLQTGKPLSEWQQVSNVALAQNPEQHWKIFAVMPDRAWLHERIQLRLDIMWQQGLVQEVIDLRQKYLLTPDMPSMRCVGYRQVWDFLEKINKEITIKLQISDIINQHSITDSLPNLNSSKVQECRQSMQNEALYATRQLAKRQYTWMRKLITTQQFLDRFDLQQLQTVEQARSLLISVH